MAEELAATFSREEVEAEFSRYWKIGCVDEQWGEWLELFTDDVRYHDHFWGELRGKREIGLWIDSVMKGVPEVYTVLDWYKIDGDTVTFHYQNRRDNPGTEGPRYWDFPGMSIAVYAGNGLWSYDEDFWDAKGARRTAVAYAEACDRAGAHTPEQRLLRGHWPAGPAWARTEEAPHPSWVGHEDLPGVTKQRELAELLGRPLS